MKRKRIPNDSKGFSLVELIVVIAILVILMILLIPNIVGYISKAQKAVVQGAANEIYNASGAYLAHHISAGEEFTPNSTLTANVLWSDDEQLIQEPKDYTRIDIVLDDNGTAIDYVYYENGDFYAYAPPGIEETLNP